MFFLENVSQIPTSLKHCAGGSFMANTKRPIYSTQAMFPKNGHIPILIEEQVRHLVHLCQCYFPKPPISGLSVLLCHAGGTDVGIAAISLRRKST